MYKFIEKYLKEDISFDFNSYLDKLNEDEKKYYFNLNEITSRNINFVENNRMYHAYSILKEYDSSLESFNDLIVFDREKDRIISMNSIFNIVNFSEFKKKCINTDDYIELRIYCYKDSFYYCLIELDKCFRYLAISKKYFYYFNKDNYIQWNNNVEDRAYQLENKLDESYLLTEYEIFEIIKSGYSSSLSKFKNILDFGCGCGYFTNSLNNMLLNFKFTESNIKGIDLSKKSIEFCKEKYKNVKNLSFDCVDICDLKEDSKYDLITSVMVLHSIKNIEDIVKSFNRLLNDNGYLIISIPDPIYYLYNKGYVKNLKEVLNGNDEEDFYIPFKIHNNEELKSKIYFCNRKVSKYLEIFEKYGFKILEKVDVKIHHINPSINIFYLRKIKNIKNDTEIIDKNINKEGLIKKMIEKDNIIKNENGSSYEIIGCIKDYYLLKSLYIDQYVIAYNIKKLKNGNYEWNFGHYFNGKKIPFDTFIEKSFKNLIDSSDENYDDCLYELKHIFENKEYEDITGYTNILLFIKKNLDSCNLSYNFINFNNFKTMKELYFNDAILPEIVGENNSFIIRIRPFTNPRFSKYNFAVSVGLNDNISDNQKILINDIFLKIKDFIENSDYIHYWKFYKV